MKKMVQVLNNVPRNVVILAVIVTVILGIFHLIPLLILVWIVALTYITIYQYRTPKNKEANFVCLDCATIHQQDSCPKCGSKLKKLYSKTSSYGV